MSLSEDGNTRALLLFQGKKQAGQIGMLLLLAVFALAVEKQFAPIQRTFLQNANANSVPIQVAANSTIVVPQKRDNSNVGAKAATTTRQNKRERNSFLLDSLGSNNNRPQKNDRRTPSSSSSSSSSTRDLNKYVTALPYDFTSSESRALKVPYPIFVLNLPKSGTTTIWQYFACGIGPSKAVHWWTDNKKQMGPCLEYNVNKGQAPLHRCGDFDVWVDCGYATRTKCFFPAVHGLDAFYEHYPNATLLLIRRDVDSWYKSASRWGPMFQKWSTSCRHSFFPDAPHNTTTTTLGEADFKGFYHRVTLHIRQFAKDHPSMTYLEPPGDLTLSSPEIGLWLEENVGIEASCWGKCQPNGQTAKCENETN